MSGNKIIFAFKQHFDIGYTDTVEEVTGHFRTTLLDKALQIFDQNKDEPESRQFAWTVPGWPAFDSIGPRQTPERREKILNAIRKKRIAVHALPFTFHTASLELEDLVRSMTFASRVHRQAGLKELPRDAKMTDVLSHAWAIPTLLKHAGVDMMHIGCNSANKEPDVPVLFWWEGPDGSRVLTMYGMGGYGSSLTPPETWPYNAWLSLMHTGDNAGPPSGAGVAVMVKKALQEMPDADIKLGRMSDFYDALMEEDPDIPVVRGDMPDTWIQGVMSMPLETKLARKIRPMAGFLQAVNTHLAAWNVRVPDLRQTLENAYEQSVLYGEHTWGWATEFFGQRFEQEWQRVYAAKKYKYKMAERTWVEHGDYMRRTQSLIEPEMENHLKSLAEGAGVEGKRVIVYNALPWQRDGVVEIAAGPPSAGTTADVAGTLRGFKDLTTDEIVPVERHGETLRFICRNVPSSGYKSYVPESSIDREITAQNGDSDLQMDRKNSTIENHFFRITLDPDFTSISSIVDKTTGRELVDRSAEYPFGYLYERFNKRAVTRYCRAYLTTGAQWARKNNARAVELMPKKETEYILAPPRGATLELKKTAVSVKAEMSAKADKRVPHDVTITVTLFRELPHIDIEWRILNKQLEPWPEAGWLSLPFLIHKPDFSLGRLGSIVDPARDVVRGTNRDVYCLNSGVNITSPDGHGVGVCALDSPLVSLERPGLYRYSPDFVPAKPIVFVNTYNNCWGTNFQVWTDCSWSSRVRLWTVGPEDGIDRMLEPSWEARTAIMAASADGKAGPLPSTRAGLSLSRPGILMSAFGPDPDGDGGVLRLWEQMGSEEPCTVVLPDGFDIDALQPADLRGRPSGEPIQVADRTFTLQMHKYAPVSLLFRFPDKGHGGA